MIEFVKNVALQNDTLSLPVSASLNLSAVVLIEKAHERLDDIGQQSFERVVQNYLSQDFSLWLLVGHGAAQPSSRVVRHLKLWKSLEKRGLDIPSGNRVEEFEVAENGGIRFFGAIRISVDALSDSYRIIRQERGSCVIITNEPRSTLISVLRKGWRVSPTNPPEEILDLVSNGNSIAFGIYGEFDDSELAVAAIGSERLLRQQEQIASSD
jgi:hypothetical protein